ncbi:hypothetical protein D6789_02845 [Candidatus Woesearchaeota archaeon]|nr:MAG: hypothetical protein D6789_02845 [Candidatus Woesearchaeota archaeon]
MAISEEQLNTIRTALDASARPLFFFDDDCDGTTSFVQLYRYKKDGRGIPVKANPKVGAQYVRKVEENSPDLVIILDKPLVDEEFLDAVKTPIIWLDHHEPVDTSRWKHVRYYNPRVNDDTDNRPTTHWAFAISGGPLWLAVVGSAADWHIPDHLEQFKKEYGDLLPPQYATVQDLLFHPDSGIGKLVKVINFNLKDTVSETMKSVKVLTRIESPYEILKQTTPKGKYLYKKYARLAKKYNALLERAKTAYKRDDPLLIFTYTDDQMSMTSDLSNELLYLFPDKLIMVARNHNGELKYSLRSAGNIAIPPVLEKAFTELDGYGGGHTYACGACIKVAQNPRFVEIIREAL